jgi:hypothetical protein
MEEPTVGLVGTLQLLAVMEERVLPEPGVLVQTSQFSRVTEGPPAEPAGTLRLPLDRVTQGVPKATS